MSGFFAGGGVAFLLIGALSIAALAIIVEKCWYIFFKLKINADYFLAYILKLIESDNFSKAIGLCDSLAKHPLSLVVKAGLLKANRSDKEIERSLDQASAKVIPEIFKRTGYLAMLANLSTLIGLLGTILGLIDAFSAMNVSDPAARAELLAVSVSAAMKSTAMGIIVAAPCILFHGILRSREQKLAAAIDHCSITILNLLSSRNAKLLQKK